MANRVILLCLAVAIFHVNLIECKRGGGSHSRGGGSHSSHSSWGKPSGGQSWGSSSGSSWSKPSPTSWGSSSSNVHSSWSSGSSYPSSSSGLSGSGSSKPSYPSSSSGLSGFGSHSSYPPSNGLSGSGSSKPSYPASTGLSGSGSSHPSYPSSSTGLSGSGSSKPSYPPSNGFSGTGSSKPSYPPSYGVSGSGYSRPSNNQYPTYNSAPSYNTGSNYRPTYGTSYQPNNVYHHGSGYTGYNPSYTHFSHTPSYVYVHEYRQSESPYSNLLTGLALYNLGRSHNDYHHHYYYDDYYRRRYDSPSSSYRPADTPKDTAKCVLKINENDKVQVLKVPCEIVSTFTEGSKQEPQVRNTTVCVTNATVVNNTSVAKPAHSIETEQISGFNISTTISPENATVVSLKNSSVTSTTTTDRTLKIIPIAPESVDAFLNLTTEASIPLNSSASTELPLNTSTTNVPVTLGTNKSNETGSANISSNTISSNITSINITTCSTTVEEVDPLKVTGPPINANSKKMECSVEIQTATSVLRHPVDCGVLLEYSKMPEAKKESTLLPNRSTLKQWYQKPPWWLAAFIAV